MTEAERRLRRAAEVVLDTEPTPGPAPLPDFAALIGARRRRARFGAVTGALGFAGVAALLIAFVLRDPAPIASSMQPPRRLTRRRA